MEHILTMYCTDVAEEDNALWITCSCGWASRKWPVTDEQQARRLADTLCAWGRAHREEANADTPAA